LGDQDVRTPHARAKPREYGEGSWRSYQSHFERVASINQWEGEKLDHLWLNLTGAALGFVVDSRKHRRHHTKDFVPLWINTLEQKDWQQYTKPRCFHRSK